jgi:hypothetical protein
MFLQVSTLPYSIFGLLIEDSKKIDDKTAYRPDRIVTDQYGENFFYEVLCNQMSNLSPLSAKNGRDYLLPSYFLINTFMGVQG